MNPRPDPDGEDGLRIHEVSERLNIPAPTLRSWERRYGVPITSRSTGGHRRYADSELQQLRLMRDDIARGKSAADAARAVQVLVDQTASLRSWVLPVLDASEQEDPGAMRAALDRAREALGLPVALDGVVLPAMRQVGSWWESGRCGVGQEHMTTETVRGWMARIRTIAITSAIDAPILLACGPKDLHTVGLEAMAALLAERGRSSRIVGPKTSERTLLAASRESPSSPVVVVSHLRSHRTAAVDALRAVEATGTRTFFAGNAFAHAPQRDAVPGVYLGESLAGAIEILLDAVPSSDASRPSAVS